MLERILCVEDDLTTQVLVGESLRDYNVVRAGTIFEARKQLQVGEVAAILIDIQLPDGDGIQFLGELVRDQRYRNLPILILSSHTDVAHKVSAFSIGAEDFIAKPFDPIELNARVTAKIRKNRLEKHNHRHRQVGDVLIDFDRQKAFRISESRELDLELTGKELGILALLTKRMEQVYSRDQIMDSVWGNTAITDRTVDSHIAHLRRKLAGTAVKLETSKSFGYRAVLNS